MAQSNVKQNDGGTSNNGAAGAASSSRMDFEGQDMEIDFDTTYIPCSVALNEEVRGKVVGGSDWCNFYLRPNNCDVELLDMINGSMNSAYDNAPDMISVKRLMQSRNFDALNFPCAVRYTKDGKWYRARLEDPAYNMVRFIDYGNVQMCADEDIKPLLRLFTETLPVTAIACTLTEAQDADLPSFGNEDDTISVTILSPMEPYEVTVKLASPGATGAGAKANSYGATASASVSNALPRTLPHSRQFQRQAEGDGLTMLPQRSFATMDDNNGDDLKGAKANTGDATSRAVPSRFPRAPIQTQQNQYCIQNAVGTVDGLYATCGTITANRYPARRCEANTQQSSFRGGPLLVEDLRRIFQNGEQVRFSAKFDQPYVSQGMEWSRMVAEDNDKERKKKNAEQQVPDTGRWLVTDFKPLDDDETLITHAVVAFVGDAACSLYVRGTETNIWAPKGTFPREIATSERPLREILDIGRSVVVRAEPAQNLADFKIKSEWVAKGVEFVGQILEEKGTMYLVRDNYSVIITEGNVGFGYAFVANQFVESAGVPLSEWYGTRVYFRSCVDVPDKDADEVRYGIRMKALRAQLSPEETKGPYRFAGIYRPPSVRTYEDGARPYEKEKGKKPTEDDSMDLPRDTVREMNVLGVDAIGIAAQSVPEVPETMEMVLENLRNEMRFENMQAAAGVSRGVFVEPVEEASTVEITVLDLSESQELPPPLQPTPKCEPNLVERRRPDVSSGCETELTHSKEEEERLRKLALDEMRDVVENDDILVKWMKFAQLFPKESSVRRRFYDLMSTSMASKGE